MVINAEVTADRPRCTRGTERRHNSPWNHRTASAAVWSSTPKCSAIAWNAAPPARISAAWAAIRWYTGVSGGSRNSKAKTWSSKVRRHCERVKNFNQLVFSGLERSSPLRGVRPRRWRCGCRARTARRSRRRWRVCESTTPATGSSPRAAASVATDGPTTRCPGGRGGRDAR